MAGQLYELPFHAEDLEPGERLSTRQHAAGIQGLGKDVGVRRYVGNSTWSSRRPGVPTDRNESLLVYGKPFYAMADGVVVAGWRNAPDNPGPGQTHPERETGRIGGGGNCLWVLQDDGVMALYAHAQPGSIPRRLVPIDAELLSGPKPDGHAGFHPETVIPPNERVRVRRGEFLGVCGNSGRSGGPHLHVHMEAGKSADGSGRSTAHPMTFARGLATPRKGDKADIDAWTRFAGETIPDGEVLVWPPRSLSGEYARHGFPVSDYQRMFDHLVDSGFSPHWFDGYSVGGEVFLNFVFRPAEVPFRAFHGLTATTYQRRFDEAVADGYQPVLVESYLQHGEARYAAVFRKGKSGSFRARHGLDDGQHQAEFDSAQAAGLRPVSVSVVSVGGERRYTALYRSDGVGSWRLKSRIKQEGYQAEFDANTAAGRRPVYLGGYKHAGEVFYSAVFAANGSDAFRAGHGLTSAQYQAAFDANTKANFGTEVVTGVDGASSQHRFAGVWVKK
jgi:hypothetical protein